MYYLTLDYTKNKLRINCPIFNAETSMASCVMLRDLVWKGQAPDNKRLGCQACIRSGKCPATSIVQRIMYGKAMPDEYGSREPKMGKLSVQILERVERVMIQDTHLNQLGVPQNERDLIATANERIAKMKLTAPNDSTASYVRVTAPSIPSSTKTATKRVQSPANKNAGSSAVKSAAMTGDMTAAINAGA